MQQQRHREQLTAVDFAFDQSNVVEMSRHVGTVDRRLFSVPPASAFHSYHDDHGRGQRHQFDDDTAESRTDEEFDERDSQHTDDDGGSERGGEDTARDAAVDEDRGAPLSQLTPRKHDYSVAELLRDDRPSSSSVRYHQHHDVGPSNRRRHDESTTSPSQTAGGAFLHRWTGENVDRAMPPPAFQLTAAAHRHRWIEWTSSDSWRRPEFTDATAQRRCLDLFPAPSVNFVANYTSRHLRHGTELHPPLSSFGQQYSIPRRPGKL